MPRLSVLLIRTALVYFAVGFTLGCLMLVEKAVRIDPVLWRFFDAHVEFLLVGWTVQLAMGVAFWMLPRFEGGTSRGNEPAAWTAFFLVNAGVLLAGLGSFLGLPQAVSLVGRLCEAGAALAFAVHAWPRIRPSPA
ncbi:MAG: hypothetical protein A2V83_04335 [Nitrospirae bacterium RBG_16_64_22]|nr:MAG: hypothetical protein A2V83_04335 [Nitrospirae bacterium RBG_16_64_22]